MTIHLAEQLIPWIDDRLIAKSDRDQDYESTRAEIIAAVMDPRVKWQMHAFSQRFRGKTTAGQIRFLKELHQFVHQHFLYKADGFGKQQIKQPAICFYERSLGADCKSLSNFICATLFHLDLNVGISTLVYKVEKTANLKFVQGHVFPWVLIDNHKFILDATLPDFNREVTSKIKHKEEILCY